MDLNWQTIHLQRMKANGEQALAMHSSFKPGVPLIIHWDSKLVVDEPDQQKSEGLSNLVSGEGIVMLLNVPKL